MGKKTAYWLIFLRSGEIRVSRKAYSSWHAVQETFAGYMTSLEFTDFEAMKNWLLEEYPEQESIIKDALQDFYQEHKTEVALPI